MPEDYAVLTRQIEALESRLDSRLSRIETALLGDKELEVQGLAGQIKNLNDVADELAEARKEGDAALHQRVDRLERLAYFAAGIAVASGGMSAWQWFLT